MPGMTVHPAARARASSGVIAGGVHEIVDDLPAREPVAGHRVSAALPHPGARGLHDEIGVAGESGDARPRRGLPTGRRTARRPHVALSGVRLSTRTSAPSAERAATTAREAPAGADHRGLHAGEARSSALPAPQMRERREESLGVRIRPVPPAVRAGPDQRVAGPDPVHDRLARGEERDDRLLVRHGHRQPARSQEIGGDHERGNVVDGEREIDAGDAEGRHAPVVDDRREGMHDRIADHAEHRRVGVDRGEPVQARAAFRDPDRPGSAVHPPGGRGRTPNPAVRRGPGRRTRRRPCRRAPSPRRGSGRDLQQLREVGRAPYRDHGLRQLAGGRGRDRAAAARGRRGRRGGRAASASTGTSGSRRSRSSSSSTNANPPPPAAGQAGEKCRPLPLVARPAPAVAPPAYREDDRKAGHRRQAAGRRELAGASRSAPSSARSTSDRCRSSAARSPAIESAVRQRHTFAGPVMLPVAPVDVDVGDPVVEHGEADAHGIPARVQAEEQRSFGFLQPPLPRRPPPPRVPCRSRSPARSPRIGCRSAPATPGFGTRTRSGSPG